MAIGSAFQEGSEREIDRKGREGRGSVKREEQQCKEGGDGQQHEEMGEEQ